MDRDAIKTNAAKVGLAKLFEFALGKLTEKQNRTQTNLISDPHELYRFLATPRVEVANLVFSSDSVVWVSSKYIAEEQASSLRHTKEVIGAFVACGGRLH